MMDAFRRLSNFSAKDFCNCIDSLMTRAIFWGHCAISVHDNHLAVLMSCPSRIKMAESQMQKVHKAGMKFNSSPKVKLELVSQDLLNRLTSYMDWSLSPTAIEEITQ